MAKVALVGYSGHGLVAEQILRQVGHEVIGYCDQAKKLNNPWGIRFLGNEHDYFSQNLDVSFFVAIGDNRIRKKVIERLLNLKAHAIDAIHPSSQIFAPYLKNENTMIGALVVINPLSKIGTGVILNTACIIEHECEIGAYAHIGPGVVLCGNVFIGTGSFIGAGTVVRQGIRIGKDVTLGAGSVVVQDMPDGVTAFGNPAKIRIV